MWKRMIQRPGLRQLPEISEGATFLRKWGLIGVLIGIGAGLGALALIWCIDLVKHFVLGTWWAIFRPCRAGRRYRQYTFHMSRPWLLPVVTTAAGLLGGFLTWKFAPQTAGIGTNAAIRAFHNNDKLNLKTVHFKLITSSLTIGGGLTSGREGPMAQIGAATGASMATLLKLTARERNIALAAGLGAGIAAIFKAPLAGAIIAAEIFYKEDFEVEVLGAGFDCRRHWLYHCRRVHGLSAGLFATAADHPLRPPVVVDFVRGFGRGLRAAFAVFVCRLFSCREIL